MVIVELDCLPIIEPDSGDNDIPNLEFLFKTVIMKIWFATVDGEGKLMVAVRSELPEFALTIIV